MKNEGGRVYGYTCDLTNREDVYRVAAKVTQEVGQVGKKINLLLINKILKIIRFFHITRAW